MFRFFINYVSLCSAILVSLIYPDFYLEPNHLGYITVFPLNHAVREQTYTMMPVKLVKGNLTPLKN